MELIVGKLGLAIYSNVLSVLTRPQKNEALSCPHHHVQLHVCKQASFLGCLYELWKEFPGWQQPGRQQKNTEQRHSQLHNPCKGWLFITELKFRATRFRNWVHSGAAVVYFRGRWRHAREEGVAPPCAPNCSTPRCSPVPNDLCSCWMGSGFRGCELQEQVGLPGKDSRPGTKQKEKSVLFPGC